MALLVSGRASAGTQVSLTPKTGSLSDLPEDKYNQSPTIQHCFHNSDFKCRCIGPGNPFKLASVFDTFSPLFKHFLTFWDKMLWLIM